MRKTIAAFGLVGPLALAGTAFAADMVGVKASDQSLSGGEATASEVMSDGPGWLVVHKMTDGKPGAVIGHTAVEKGDTKDVAVDLSEPVKSGDRIIFMLHKDTGDKGKYTFGMAGSKDDPPAMKDGKPVMTAVTAK